MGRRGRHFPFLKYLSPPPLRWLGTALPTCRTKGGAGGVSWGDVSTPPTGLCHHSVETFRFLSSTTVSSSTVATRGGCASSWDVSTLAGQLLPSPVQGRVPMFTRLQGLQAFSEPAASQECAGWGTRRVLLRPWSPSRWRCVRREVNMLVLFQKIRQSAKVPAMGWPRGQSSDSKTT